MASTAITGQQPGQPVTSDSVERRGGETADMQIDEERQRELRCGLACNPALPALLIDRLIALEDAAVWHELADRDHLSEVQVRLLARSGDVQVVSRLIRRGLLML